MLLSTNQNCGKRRIAEVEDISPPESFKARKWRTKDIQNITNEKEKCLQPPV